MDQGLWAEATFSIVVEGRHPEAVDYASCDIMILSRYSVLQCTRKICTIEDKAIVTIISSIHIEPVASDADLQVAARDGGGRAPSQKKRRESTSSLVQ